MSSDISDKPCRRGKFTARLVIGMVSVTRFSTIVEIYHNGFNKYHLTEGGFWKAWQEEIYILLFPIPTKPNSYDIWAKKGPYSTHFQNHVGAVVMSWWYLFSVGNFMKEKYFL